MAASENISNCLQQSWIPGKAKLGGRPWGYTAVQKFSSYCHHGDHLSIINPGSFEWFGFQGDFNRTSIVKFKKRTFQRIGDSGLEPYSWEGLGRKRSFPDTFFWKVWKSFFWWTPIPRHHEKYVLLPSKKVEKVHMNKFLQGENSYVTSTYVKKCIVTICVAFWFPFYWLDLLE